MGMVLWIDQNVFASSLIEKAFKKKGLPFYTLDHATDFVYLIKDLNPEVLVLDGETLLKDLERVKEQFEESRFGNKPMILLESRPGLEFLHPVVGELKRPLDPFQVQEEIKKILNKLS